MVRPPGAPGPPMSRLMVCVARPIEAAHCSAPTPPVPFSLMVSVVGSADAAPTQQALLVFEQAAAVINEQLARLKELFETDLAGFNRLVREAEIAAIIPPN